MPSRAMGALWVCLSVCLWSVDLSLYLVFHWVNRMYLRNTFYCRLQTRVNRGRAKTRNRTLLLATVGNLLFDQDTEGPPVPRPQVRIKMGETRAFTLCSPSNQRLPSALGKLLQATHLRCPQSWHKNETVQNVIDLKYLLSPLPVHSIRYLLWAVSAK